MRTLLSYPNPAGPLPRTAGRRGGQGRGWRGMALAVLLLAGCASAAKPTVAPDSALAAQCPDAPPTARRVTLSATDGVRLGAAQVGPTSASLGVVINQGASSSICDWLPTATDLASKGARVLVFDRRGSGSSPGPPDLRREPADVVTAGTWLLRSGARKLLLVGSSMGTVSAFVAASPTGPAAAVQPSNPSAPTFVRPPCGVLLVSPLTSTGGGGGSVDALAVDTWPTRLWIAYERDRGSIVAGADQVARRAESGGGTVVRKLSIPGKHHSLQLLRRHSEARALLSSAASAC